MVLVGLCVVWHVYVEMVKRISILGIRTELVPIARDKLRGLNADTILRFFFFSAVFNEQLLCIIQAKKQRRVHYSHEV